MAQRHDAVVTNAEPDGFFQTSPHFLMKGAGITPLPGSEFVTELAPMIWQF
jgi:hypothetical protein